jgi:hypothetical protein
MPRDWKCVWLVYKNWWLDRKTSNRLDISSASHWETYLPTCSESLRRNQLDVEKHVIDPSYQRHISKGLDFHWDSLTSSENFEGRVTIVCTLDTKSFQFLQTKRNRRTESVETNERTWAVKNGGKGQLDPRGQWYEKETDKLLESFSIEEASSSLHPVEILLSKFIHVTRIIYLYLLLIWQRRTNSLKTKQKKKNNNRLRWEEGGRREEEEKRIEQSKILDIGTNNKSNWNRFLFLFFVLNTGCKMNSTGI